MHITDKSIKFVGVEWSKYIADEFEKDYIKDIQQGLVASRKKGFVIYPEQKNVFRAFHETPLNRVKVVWLGQDPYHDGSATGLAFESPNSNPSLSKIQEVYTDCFPSHFNTDLLDGNLTPWAKEGVFLFNTALTVRKGQPGKHLKHWAPFAQRVVYEASQHPSFKVFLLAGANAQKYAEFIDDSKHTVIKCEHPAYAARQQRRWNVGKLFHTINHELEKHNIEPIAWEK